MTAHRERAALLALLRADSELPWHARASVAEDLGGPAALLSLPTDRLPEAVRRLVASVSADDVEQAQRDLDTWHGRGLELTTILDTDYPLILRSAFDRPPLLFFQGSLGVCETDSVSVVGTRDPSELGVRRAQRLAHELTDAGFTVASGLALGVDTAAHKAALDRGRTFAVLGTGISRIYPESNSGLAQQIVSAGGALVSQFLPDQPPTRYTFPMRNATMSGMTLATVVIEAGPTSGSRNQARQAFQHGRRVFLLKSLVDTTKWARAMVDAGRATAVSGAADVIAALSDLDQLTTEPNSLFFDADADADADATMTLFG